jgi:dihydroxy-acid dehydratase
MSEKELRRYSRVVVDGVEQAPSRAMLRAVGFSEDDFQRPQIGIASTWSMVTPCNMHIDGLADEAAKGADEAGAKGVIFNTISVSASLWARRECGIRSYPARSSLTLSRL